MKSYYESYTFKVHIGKKPLLDLDCQLCDHMIEDADHLLLSCPLAN